MPIQMLKMSKNILIRSRNFVAISTVAVSVFTLCSPQAKAGPLITYCPPVGQGNAPGVEWKPRPNNYLGYSCTKSIPDGRNVYVCKTSRNPPQGATTPCTPYQKSVGDKRNWYNVSPETCGPNDPTSFFSRDTDIDAYKKSSCR